MGHNTHALSLLSLVRLLTDCVQLQRGRKRWFLRQEMGSSAEVEGESDLSSNGPLAGEVGEGRIHGQKKMQKTQLSLLVFLFSLSSC